tara:strand:+ start:5832 stop:6143 length:312 start_codon:yes stop_codon:yes gene_type:complete
MAITHHAGKLIILSDRLTTLCKVYREGEDTHFAQYLVQTGEIGEAIIKGLESPEMSMRDRVELHKRIKEVAENDFGYKSGKYQRKKHERFITAKAIMNPPKEK